jgi:hypothetical protein
MREPLSIERHTPLVTAVEPYACRPKLVEEGMQPVVVDVVVVVVFEDVVVEAEVVDDVVVEAEVVDEVDVVGEADLVEEVEAGVVVLLEYLAVMLGDMAAEVDVAEVPDKGLDSGGLASTQDDTVSHKQRATPQVIEFTDQALPEYR